MLLLNGRCLCYAGENMIATSKKRLKALVVDDEYNIRSLLTECLFRAGFICNEADDGVKALREIKQARYDLVVTDLRMPNRHGHTLCQVVLNQPDRPRLVVVTGVNDRRIFRDLEARGVDHIFEKPIDPPAFVDRLRELGETITTARERDARGRDERAANLAEPGLPEASAVPAVAVLMRDRGRAQSLISLLRHEQVLPLFADHTDALYELAAKHRLALVVLENARFGFLEPQELTRHLGLSSSSPEIILLGDDDPATREALADWTPTPKILSIDACDSDVVLAVRSKIGAMRRSPRSISAFARSIVRPLAPLQPGQQALLKLATFLETSGSDLKADRLVAAVTSDAEATAEILRLAKGASAGLRGPVTTAGEAIGRIGPLRTAALLMSSGLKNAEKSLVRQMPPPLRDWYQRRSVVNATFASVFAQKQSGLSGDVAFVLGLFQDLGIAVAGAAFGARYARLVTRAHSCGPTHLHVVERQDLGVEHAELSAALMEQWGLPQSLLNAVRRHHGLNPPGDDARELLPYLSCMRLAESVADLCDNRHPSRREEFLRQLTDCFDGQPARDFRALGEAVDLASEIAQQFRVSFAEEALLKNVFRGLDPATVDPNPRA
jgi:HD-like signal output (HDOD) protein/DNA-binding NarL/FixJ family response regulator